ncbi:MAG TPA: hypothetical protein VFX98_11985, partial [Longimicrobiaceae bacterium]|nr:hypothetical protein [Longimicrobiaceae bacterium]
MPSDLGLELYVLARQVRLAAQCRPERRQYLFRDRSPRHVGERRTEALDQAPADLRSDLRVLMQVNGRRPPDDAYVAAACEAVATWAQDTGYPNTAVHFAEAGAAIRPRGPYPAFVAGRTNRTVGDPWRAEVFYGRSIRYAYQEQEWPVYVRAHLGLGRLLTDRGHLSAAAKHLYTAARVALDQGEEWLAAQTYHDLLLLHFELEDEQKVEEYARKALETYPRHHERYPLAVHDYAFAVLISRRR